MPIPSFITGSPMYLSGTLFTMFLTIINIKLNISRQNIFSVWKLRYFSYIEIHRNIQKPVLTFLTYL